MRKVIRQNTGKKPKGCPVWMLLVVLWLSMVGLGIWRLTTYAGRYF